MPLFIALLEIRKFLLCLTCDSLQRWKGKKQKMKLTLSKMSTQMHPYFVKKSDSLACPRTLSFLTP